MTTPQFLALTAMMFLVAHSSEGVAHAAAFTLLVWAYLDSRSEGK